MQLDGEFYSNSLLLWIGLGYGLILFQALRMAPWRRLRDNEQTHVFFGACVSLILLWSMRVPVEPGLSFHFLGVTSLVLMFGWSLGVIGSALALVGVTINQHGAWELFALNALLAGVLPVTLTQVILVLVRSLLPKNFFVYVLGNAFLTAGVVAIVSAYVAVALLVNNDVYSWEELSQVFLPFFPLMFLPEAVLNGWVMTVVVAYRPQWVGSFNDDLYLKGK